MLLTDSVMRTEQPGLQIGEGDVNHRQMGVGLFTVAIEYQGLVRVPQLCQPIVAVPSIGAHHCSFHHVFLHEPGERRGAAVWRKAQAQSPGIQGFLTLLAVGAKRPRTNLDGPNNYRLVMDTAAFALGASAHKCLIYFDRILGANGVTFRAHHASAELVKNQEGGLVAHSQLPLKLHCRHTRRLRRHQVSPPEPWRQRRMALSHDGASRKRDIGMARAAPQYDRPSLGKTVRLAHIPALETRKPVRPPQMLKVSCAGRVIGEYPLKFWERRRKTTGIHDRNLASDYRIGNKPDRQGRTNFCFSNKATPNARPNGAGCGTSRPVMVSAKPSSRLGNTSSNPDRSHRPGSTSVFLRSAQFCAAAESVPRPMPVFSVTQMMS